MDRNRCLVLEASIDACSWAEVLERIVVWAAQRESRYVCICNVHSVVTALQEKTFRNVVNEADMATPDGMPIAWTLRKLGFHEQSRINGPDLMWKYCELAATLGHTIFLFGSTDATLELLQGRLAKAFPRLRIAGAYSPPFCQLSAEEDQKITTMINDSGANVVFVGLGCPKQEFWMAKHRGKIQAVMIGVGAAFDYHAGTVNRAPLWMQNSGLEWFYRLVSEPRRLWRRYLITNSLFIFHIMRQFLNVSAVTKR